jgi:hypothetical protein
MVVIQALGENGQKLIHQERFVFTTSNSVYSKIQLSKKNNGELLIAPLTPLVVQIRKLL